MPDFNIDSPPLGQQQTPMRAISAPPTSLIKVKAARRTSMRAIKRERAGEA
jgi:hypothetical protein